MKKARRAHEAGDLAGACLLYRKIAKDNATDLDAWYLLGTAEAERGRLQAAAAAFTQAEVLDPRSAQVQNNFGNVLYTGGDLDGAGLRYRRAVDLDPRLAQARFNLGRTLRAQQKETEAVVQLQVAAELEPGFLPSRHLLGVLLMELGHPDQALAHLRASASTPEFPLAAEAQHLLDGLEGRNPAHPPRSYVQDLFDRYAPRFEAHLTDELAYTAPEQAAAALGELRPGPAPLGRVLDLGCGTGLSGAALRSRSAFLCGVDLSPKMLDLARGKGLYDQLMEGDATEFLKGAPPASFNLILALDTLIYIGDPAELLDQAARVLAPGGLLAVTLERLNGDSPSGFRLLSTGRYAHAPAEFRAQAQSFGLQERLGRPLDLRRQGATWIEGWLGIFESSSS